MKKRRFIAVLITLLVFVWHCGDKEIASDDLMGVWKTSEPRYADRFIKIGKDTITFGTGGENFESYSIKKIYMKKVPIENSILYTIHYKNREGVWNKFAFYYSPVNGGVIRLKNQKQMVWTKEQSDR